MSQINAVEAPIINLPYVPPAYHWHVKEGKRPEKRPGRRLSSYLFRVPDRAARGRRSKGQRSLLDDAPRPRNTCWTWPASSAILHRHLLDFIVDLTTGERLMVDV